MSAPAFIEVFGDDGELFPLPVDDASDEALADAIQILVDRCAAIDADISGLRSLLASRRVGPKSAEQVRQEGYRQSIQALRDLARRGEL